VPGNEKNPGGVAAFGSEEEEARERFRGTKEPVGYPKENPIYKVMLSLPWGALCSLSLIKEERGEQ